MLIKLAQAIYQQQFARRPLYCTCERCEALFQASKNHYDISDTERQMLDELATYLIREYFAICQQQLSTSGFQIPVRPLEAA